MRSRNRVQSDRNLARRFNQQARGVVASSSLTRSQVQDLGKKDIGSYITRSDLFGTQFRMRLDAGKQSLNSIGGTLMSLLLVATLIFYAQLKFDVLINKKDVDVLSSIYENVFTADDEFGYQNGFNVAAAFTAYDSGTEYILDETYGELVFKHYYWGI